MHSFACSGELGAGAGQQLGEACAHILAAVSEWLAPCTGVMEDSHRSHGSSCSLGSAADIHQHTTHSLWKGSLTHVPSARREHRALQRSPLSRGRPCTRVSVDVSCSLKAVHGEGGPGSEEGDNLLGPRHTCRVASQKAASVASPRAAPGSLLESWSTRSPPQTASASAGGLTRARGSSAKVSVWRREGPTLLSCDA